MFNIKLLFMDVLFMACVMVSLIYQGFDKSIYKINWYSYDVLLEDLTRKGEFGYGGFDNSLRTFGPILIYLFSKISISKLTIQSFIAASYGICFRLINQRRKQSMILGILSIIIFVLLNPYITKSLKENDIRVFYLPLLI